MNNKTGKKNLKVTIYFYKNVGIETYTSFYNQSEIFYNIFKEAKEVELDEKSKFIIHQLGNDSAFMSYVREKDNTNPNIKVKDKGTNRIIEDPSFIYNAFIYFDHNSNLIALLGEKTALSKLQQYIIDKSELLISEKHISILPLHIDRENIKRKIRTASKIKFITIPYAFEDIKENFAYLREIQNAVDTKKIYKLKLVIKDAGVNYVDAICNIEDKYFDELSLIIDNEQEKQEVINIFSNIFTRQVTLNINDEITEDIDNLKMLLKKELDSVKKDIVLRGRR